MLLINLGIEVGSRGVGLDVSVDKGYVADVSIEDRIGDVALRTIIDMVIKGFVDNIKRPPVWRVFVMHLSSVEELLSSCDEVVNTIL